MIRTLIILLLGINVFGCQKDQYPTAGLPQTWKLVGVQSPRLMGDQNFQPISDSSYTYVFKKDGNFSKTVGTETSWGTYQIDTQVYAEESTAIRYALHFPDDRLRDSCYPNQEEWISEKNGC